MSALAIFFDMLINRFHLHRGVGFSGHFSMNNHHLILFAFLGITGVLSPKAGNPPKSPPEQNSSNEVCQTMYLYSHSQVLFYSSYTTSLCHPYFFVPGTNQELSC